MRTIHYSKKHEAVVTHLGGTSHPRTKQPIFLTYRELACFAAVLGYEHDAKDSLEADQDDLVDGRNFVNQQSALDLMYLIALAHSRDINILRDEKEDEMVKIFEEFANGGLRILSDWLREKPEDPHGDKAILAALNKYGYLASGGESSAAEAATEVSF